MFGVIRIILGGIFFALSNILIIKLKLLHKKQLIIVSLVVALVMITSLSFVPFENAFITFNSPEASYNYTKFGKSNVELVVSGNYSDFVVDVESSSEQSYLIIPKNSDGWKIGLGINTKKIDQIFVDGISVNLYQYKNTDDYFINIIGFVDEMQKVSDSCNSVFYSLEKENAFLGTVYICYFAHIGEYNSDYSITIGNATVSFDNQ